MPHGCGKGSGITDLASPFLLLTPLRDFQCSVRLGNVVVCGRKEWCVGVQVVASVLQHLQ